MGRKMLSRLLVAALGLLLLASSGAPGLRWQDAEAAGDCEGQFMQLHFIDVGQADAVLLEFPCGAILVDSGAEGREPYKSRLLTYLRQFFNSRQDLNWTLESVVRTHPHIDHARGLPALFDAGDIKIKRYIDSGEKGDGPDGESGWVLDGVPYAKKIVDGIARTTACCAS